MMLTFYNFTRLTKKSLVYSLDYQETPLSSDEVFDDFWRTLTNF